MLARPATVDSRTIVGDVTRAEGRQARRESRHSLVTVLGSIPALEPCDEGTLLAIVGDSVNLFWPAGASVFERGSPPDGLFIVLAGAVRVVAPDGSEVARLRPGDYFGELSLLLGGNHTYDVAAAEDSELMVVPKERFDALLAGSPELATAIRRTARERAAADVDGPTTA